MPVLFRKYDVEEVVSPERLGVIYPKSEQTSHSGRFGLVFEGVGEDDSQTPHRRMPVLAQNPGKAVCVSTEISERKYCPDTLVVNYSLQVEVAFILSHAGGRVRHHATVMQNVIGQAKPGARALKARLTAIEKQLRRIDLSGMRIPRVVNTVRSDVWFFDHQPGGKEDGLYSVLVSYLN